jgi:hypothetical protein
MPKATAANSTNAVEYTFASKSVSVPTSSLKRQRRQTSQLHVVAPVWRSKTSIVLKLGTRIRESPASSAVVTTAAF